MNTLKSIAAAILLLLFASCAHEDAAPTDNTTGDQTNNPGNVIATETEIDVADLLPEITDYLNRHYAEYTIAEAEIVTNAEGIFYEVDLENGEQEVEVLFDDDGNFIEQIIEEADDENNEEDDDDEEEDDEEENEREIDPDALPQSIKDDITGRYPGAVLREADEVTQQDGSITYDVEIATSDGTIIELMYDADGNFLGIETEDDDQESDD